MTLSMKPIDYLTNKEKYVLKKIQEDLSKGHGKEDLRLLESMLDELLVIC